jgi:hypothetical protein
VSDRREHREAVRLELSSRHVPIRTIMFALVLLLCIVSALISIAA